MSGAKTTTSNTVTPWVPDQSTFDTFKARAQGTISPEYTQAMQAASNAYSSADAAYGGIAGQYAGMNASTNPALRTQMQALGESGISGRFQDVTSREAGLSGRFRDVTSREAGVIDQLAGLAGQSAGVDGDVMAVLRRAMDPNARSAAFDQVRQNTINSIMPSINSSFAGSGMTGSSLHAQNLSKGLSAGVADVENQAYQQGADRALTAGTTLQGILSNDFDQRLNTAQAVQGASAQAYRDNLAAAQALQGADAQAYRDNLAAAQALQGAESQAYRDNLSAAQALQGATFTDRGQQLNAVNSMADFDAQEFARRMGLLGAQSDLIGSRAGLAGARAGLASDQQSTSNAALMGLLGTATGAASTTQTTQKNPGLFGILGAGAQIAGMFSDERLKQDVKRVGRMDDGTPIYTYRYKEGVPDPSGGKVHMGVMAQDVAEANSAAVGEADGFLTVDYGAL